MPPTSESSGVEHKETPRPPDNAVVTDELEASGSETQAAAGGAEGDQTGSKSRTSAAEQSNNDDDSNAARQGKKRDRHAEKRIRRLNRQLAAERDRNTANERKIAELERSIQEIKTSTAEKPPEPKLEDFKNPQEYAKAYGKWDREHGEGASPPSSSTTTERKPTGARDDASARDGSGQGRRNDDAAGPSDEALKSFNDKGKQRLGDEFLIAQEAAQAGEFAVNRVMGDFILESDYGPEIFVYLSDHPDLSREIYDKSETYAVKELEKLATKAKDGKLIDGDLDTDDTSGKDGKSGRGKDDGEAKKDEGGARRPGDTKAPDPPSGGDRSQVRQPVDPDSMDMEDYAAMRDREERDRLKGK